MSEQIEQRVLNVFRKVFPRIRQFPDEQLKAKVRRGGIEEWDSLGHMTLLSALNDEFSIRITPGQALKIKNVGDAGRLVEELIQK